MKRDLGRGGGVNPTPARCGPAGGRLCPHHTFPGAPRPEGSRLEARKHALSAPTFPGMRPVFPAARLGFAFFRQGLLDAFLKDFQLVRFPYHTYCASVSRLKLLY